MKKIFTLLMLMMLALPSLKAQGRMYVAFGPNSSYNYIGVSEIDPWLDETEPGVYEGTFNLSSNRSTFIFYTESEGLYTYYGFKSGYYFLDVEDEQEKGTIQASEPTPDTNSGTLHAWRLMGIGKDGAHIDAKVNTVEGTIEMTFADGMVFDPGDALPEELYVAVSESYISVTANPETDVMFATTGDGTFRGEFNVSPEACSFIFYSVSDSGFTFYCPAAYSTSLKLNSSNPKLTVNGFVGVESESAEFRPPYWLYSISDPQAGTVTATVNLLSHSADLSFEVSSADKDFYIITSINGGAAHSVPLIMEKTEVSGVFSYTCDVPECEFRESLGGSDGIVIAGTGWYFMFTDETSIGSSTKVYGVAKGSDDIDFNDTPGTITCDLVQGTAASIPGWIIDQTPGLTQIDLDMNSRTVSVTLLEGSEVSGIDSEAPKRVTIYNLNGVLLYDGDSEEAARDLPKGIYIVNGGKILN